MTDEGGDWRGLPADPFAIPTREIAVDLWTVADEVKTFLSLEAARAKGQGGRRAAGHALLRVGRALDMLQHKIEAAREAAAKEQGS